MARRLFIAPIVLSLAIPIAFFAEKTGSAQTIHPTVYTVDQLNALFNQVAPAVPVANGDTVTLNMIVPNGMYRDRLSATVWVDTEAMNGKTGVNFDLNINKDGPGNWRLGDGELHDDPNSPDMTNPQQIYMTNVLSTGTGANRFNINQGIVDLMRGTTISLTGGTNSGFFVAEGASLYARGFNTITPSGGTAEGITFYDGSTLGLDLTYAVTGTPVLTIAGNVSYYSGQTNVSLLGFEDIPLTNPTTRQLLRYNYGIDATIVSGMPPIFVGDQTDPSVPVNERPGINFNFQVRGEDWDDVVTASAGRLSGQLQQSPYPPTTGGTTTISLVNLHSDLSVATWNGNADDFWNATSQNWDVQGNPNAHTFLHGDSVLFVGGPVNNRNITIQAGGVQIGSNLRRPDGTLDPAPGTMVVSGGSYSFINDAGSLIGIDGQGKVIVTNSTTEATFNSQNSYWGGTEISLGATLTAKTGHSLGTGTVELLTGGTLIFDIDDTYATVLNDIIGEVGTTIIKEGIGTVYLDGNRRLNEDGSIYFFPPKSDTEVREGTLVNNIGTGLLTVYLDATYDADNKDRVVAGLSDGPTEGFKPDGITPYPNPNGGSILLGSGNLFVNVDNGRVYTFSGTITGTGALSKDGYGTQILSENALNLPSTYTGGTEIHDGTIVVQRTLDAHRAISPLGTGPVTVRTAGILQFDISGAPTTLDPNEWEAAFDNEIHGSGTVLKAAFLSGDSTKDHERQTNTAVLQLTSSRSTYTGLTDVREGALRLGSVNATGKTVEARLAAGAALQFNMSDSSSASPYDRIITGAGNVDVLSGRTVYVSGTNNDDTVNYDQRLLQLLAERPSASNYTGETTVAMSAGLHLLNAAATGKTSRVLLVSASSNLFLDFDEDQLYDRYISGNGNLHKTGAGVATLDYDQDPARPNNPNDYLGTTTVSDGVLRLMYGQATGGNDAPTEQRVQVSGQGILELAFHGDYNKGIWGTGGIAKSQADTVSVLQGWSTYTGGTYIWGGTLSFTDTTSQVGNLGQGGVYFQHCGGTLQNTAANPTFNQKVEIDAGSTAIFETLESMTIIGNGGISHRELLPTDPYYNAVDTRSHFIKRGASDLTIETTAGWTGRTVVENGRLINNIPDNTELTVTSSTTRAGENIVGEYVTGNANRRVSLLLGGGIVQTAVGHTFIVNNAVEDVFEGTITGAGNLGKSGNGLFVLNGDNDYSGKTTVMEGTLRGNIAALTALVVEGKGTYESGLDDRILRSLEGGGIVDMQNRTLTINMFGGGSSPAVFNGQILNGRRFYKNGTGTQVFGGKFYEFKDDVTVAEGMLQIGANATMTSEFKAAGNLTVSSAGTLAVNPLAKVNIEKKLIIDGTFSVAVGNNIVRANEVSLGTNSTINLAGITSAEETRTIIQSNNDIVGVFKNVTVAGDPSTDVDYLVFGVSYDDPKAVKVGQSLCWYGGTDAHGTFTLNNADGEYDVGTSLQDITDEAKRLPGWDGKTLTKRGPGTLILSASNTYTGETLVEGGTLKLTNAEATLGSERIVLGNRVDYADGTFAYDNTGALELDFNGSMETTITGGGSGVYKTGDSTVVLTGRNYYTAPTEVKQGTLYVDGLMWSHVWVDAGAGFGGNGKIDETITFRDGSYFDWRFGKTEEQSDLLTANRVDIGNNVRVRPNTSLAEQGTLTNFYGWRILHYGDTLNNYFVGVENGANPYYDFELDYSELNWVKINGFLRSEPRALSDIVATSFMMAETKMYRSVYQQIAREWACDCPDHPTIGQRINGQVPKRTRTAWMNFVGRGDQYASEYFNEKYLFQAYGVQVGISLVSNCRNSFGIMYGREEGKLNNSSDEVRGEDNYLGFYYGHAFASDLDFRSYIGGGWQKNRLERRSNGNLYHANYGGGTFNIDAEFGRRFVTDREWMLRPFLGMDLAVTKIGNATETCEANPLANEYRSYKSSSFTQFLTRAGFELGKGWRRLDFNTGAQLAWNWADTRPSTTIYYPVTGGSVLGSGANMGRFDLIMNVGVNWYITEQRHTMFFLNYIGDIYLDRQGQVGSNTGTVGFHWRF